MHLDLLYVQFRELLALYQYYYCRSGLCLLALRVVCSQRFQNLWEQQGSHCWAVEVSQESLWERSSISREIKACVYGKWQCQIPVFINNIYTKIVQNNYSHVYGKHKTTYLHFEMANGKWQMRKNHGHSRGHFCHLLFAGNTSLNFSLVFPVRTATAWIGLHQQTDVASLAIFGRLMFSSLRHNGSTTSVMIELCIAF